MKFLEQLKKELPEKAEVEDITLEGSEIVILTKNPDFFRKNSHFIKETVDKFKKRVEIRSHPSVLMDQEEAEEKIKEIVPEEADIKNIIFLTEMSRVIIEARKLGLVIGKNGSTLHEIKNKTKWTPKIERMPVIKSQITDIIRQVLYNNVEERKKFLEVLGKKIPPKLHEKESEDETWVRLTSLGGFREIGRTGMLVQTPVSRILIDCGVNVATEGQNAYPYLTAPEFNIKELDAICITHAHLDHSGFLPYLFKYGYKGPVYCTPATRDLMTLLQLDYVDIAQREGNKVPYTKRDIEDVIKHTITVDWEEVTDIAKDTRLTLYNSGHILGASQVHLHVGEGLHNLVYTGDIKTVNTNLFQGAASKFMRLETLIMEATYGGKKDIQPSLKEAEEHLIDDITKTLQRGGKALIPVLAVGRAQEVMVVLEKYYRENKFGNDLNIYLDGMIWDATAIHTAYPENLSKKLRQRIFHEDDNPFMSEVFKRIGSQKERKALIEDGKPAVILATSGMLTGGPSIEYFKNLADDAKNSMFFVSYQAEGTLGGRIQRGKRKVALEGKKGKTEAVDVKMDIDTIEGFSGHSDRKDLMNFVGRMKPRPNKVLVCHGENSKCIDLASSLYKKYNLDTYAPKNLETVRLK